MELILLFQRKVLVWSIILTVGYKGSTGWVRAQSLGHYYIAPVLLMMQNDLSVCLKRQCQCGSLETILKHS